ncbi:uncharacterized protein F5891DRAFT_1197098 [Suillus fuscotomentosus]|uniref:Uncharacterized protein n=1 Tax=Suillus fuscotomentosus TaxID=1912939 RepID=A0AAD4DU60_9AGAM|nr:uncharacterized protein F5891DRAFT_1197098 [Suillus fuscotomentosus]KAG1892908.1 hypothetical protein F5891DRAFT_1197098 [Suillus fuscotomentosus]
MSNSSENPEAALDTILPPPMSSSSENTQVPSAPSQSSQPGTPSSENCLDKFPPLWEPPKSFILRHIFKMCCFIFTWRSDLRWLHALLKEGDNWEILHGRYLTQLNQVSTVQGLVLATVAVFISSSPPLAKDVNYTSNASYACLAESLVFSLFGLLFQLKVSAAGIIFQQRSAAKVIMEARWRIFWHLLSLTVPIIIFTISVILLLIAIVLTGFASGSETVRLYVSITFAFLAICHLVSILGSPFYYHFSDLCFRVIQEWRKT